MQCTDGILLASDSQGGFHRGLSVKRLTERKIHRIDEISALAGAGGVSDIQKAVRALRDAFAANPGERDENLYVETIEQIMLTLHKTYNITRPEYLGEKGRETFQPSIIFAGLTQGGEQKCCLFHVHHEGIAEPVDDYVTIGSGAAYAELLLKNYYRTDITINEAVGTAIYVIGRIEETDPSCGGPIQISVLESGKPGGYKELDPGELVEVYGRIWKVVDLIRTELMRKIVKGEIVEERVRDLLT